MAMGSLHTAGVADECGCLRGDKKGGAGASNGFMQRSHLHGPTRRSMGQTISPDDHPILGLFTGLLLALGPSRTFWCTIPVGHCPLLEDSTGAMTMSAERRSCMLASSTPSPAVWIAFCRVGPAAAEVPCSRVMVCASASWNPATSARNSASAAAPLRLPLPADLTPEAALSPWPADCRQYSATGRTGKERREKGARECVHWASSRAGPQEPPVRI